MITKEYVDRSIKGAVIFNQMRVTNGHLLIDIRAITLTVWCWTNPDTKLTEDCDYWNSVMGVLRMEKDNPYMFIPSPCHNCWKTVVRPRDKFELIGLRELQQDLGWHSKCGIEGRQEIPYNYGGCFYSSDLHEALVRFQVLKEMLGDMPMILKRGCTAFEVVHGDSKLWHVSKEQKEIEDYIHQKIKVRFVGEMLSGMTPTIERLWNCFQPKEKDVLGPVYRTYQHLAGKSPEEIEEWWNEPVPR